MVLLLVCMCFWFCFRPSRALEGQVAFCGFPARRAQGAQLGQQEMLLSVLYPQGTFSPLVRSGSSLGNRVVSVICSWLYLLVHIFTCQMWGLMNGPMGIPPVAVIDPFMGMLAVLERCGCEGQLECCAGHRHQCCGVTCTHQCFCLEMYRVRSTPSLACLYHVHSLFFLGLKKMYSVLLELSSCPGKD